MYKRAQRKIRRNADDAVRKAERAFKSDPSIAKQIAYWRACIRAGITPPPTHIDFTKSWVIKDRRYVNTPSVYIAHEAQDPNDTFAIFHWRYIEARSLFSTVNDALEFMISTYEAEVERAGFTLDYWFRENPDDSLRKLERAAQSRHYEDVIRYWSAALRAGILPKPTKTFTRRSDDSFVSEWSLRFTPKGLANFYVSAWKRYGFWVCEARSPIVFNALSAGQGLLDSVFSTPSEPEATAWIKKHLESMIDPKEVATMVALVNEKRWEDG